MTKSGRLILRGEKHPGPGSRSPHYSLTFSRFRVGFRDRLRGADGTSDKEIEVADPLARDCCMRNGSPIPAGERSVRGTAWARVTLDDHVRADQREVPVPVLSRGLPLSHRSGLLGGRSVALTASDLVESHSAFIAGGHPGRLAVSDDGDAGAGVDTDDVGGENGEPDPGIR